MSGKQITIQIMFNVCFFKIYQCYYIIEHNQSKSYIVTYSPVTVRGCFRSAEIRLPWAKKLFFS